MSGFQFAFPDSDTMPTHTGQFMLHLQIAFLIPLYLVYPELCPSLGHRVISAVFMSVPETAIHKDTRSVHPQHHIWAAWQPRVVQPVPETMPPQVFAHNHLRLGVFAVYCCHVVMSLLRSLAVHSLQFFQKGILGIVSCLFGKRFLGRVNFSLHPVLTRCQCPQLGRNLWYYSSSACRVTYRI